MPEELRTYDPEHWKAKVTEPEPSYWSASTVGDMPWVSFKARRMWHDARNTWRVEHGIGWWGATPERQARWMESRR